MALEEFEEDPLNEREKGFVRMRSMMDYGMGFMWLALGLFIIFGHLVAPDFARRFDDIWMKIFGGISIIYGAFRIYRGYQKKYYQ